MNRLIRLMKLPAQTSLPGLRKMEKKDCEKARALLGGYLQVSSFHYFSLRDPFLRNSTWHLSTPKKNSNIGSCPERASFPLMWLKIPTESSPTLVPSTPFQAPWSTTKTIPLSTPPTASTTCLIVSRISWATCSSLPTTKSSTCSMRSTLWKMISFWRWESRNCQFSQDFKPLKFGEGDGNLNYYLYNWRCPELEKKKLGLVLL